MYIAAIMVAAGRGTRMGDGSSTASCAKAFLPLGGVPMLVHGLRTLCAVPDLKSLVLVVGGNYLTEARQVLGQHGPWPADIDVTIGGVERQDSVAAGLSTIDAAADLVIVHDAARPFVSLGCVMACVEAAARSGAAIAALPATDTVKLVGGDAGIVRTLDRQSVWLAQTPQVFRTILLRQAYTQAAHDGFSATDDAALVERTGVSVHVVRGEPANRKITTQEDLRWAEWHLRQGIDDSSIKRISRRAAENDDLKRGS